MQTHEQLRAIFPNEQVKQRLEGEVIFIAQEWSEVYSREKERLVKSHVDELRSTLEMKVEGLDKEWAEVNEQFKAQGYSAEIHERYQVRLLLPYLLQHVFIYAKNLCGYWRM